LTGQLEGRVDLRALLPDSPHFVPGEQTLHFDVAKAVPAATGSASKITIAPGPSAMVPYISTSLPPAAATIFFDRFATVGVWVFPHGVQRLMRIIRGETEQHCNLNWLKNERQTQNGQDVKSYHRHCSRIIRGQQEHWGYLCFVQHALVAAAPVKLMKYSAQRCANASGQRRG
jgi:hypothetical protein